MSGGEGKDDKVEGMEELLALVGELETTVSPPDEGDTKEGGEGTTSDDSVKVHEVYLRKGSSEGEVRLRNLEHGTILRFKPDGTFARYRKELDCVVCNMKPNTRWDISKMHNGGPIHWLRDIYLKLIPTGDDGDVRIIACDKDGARRSAGNLLRLGGSDGLYKHLSIDKSLALSLDTDGCLIEDEG